MNFFVKLQNFCETPDATLKCWEMELIFVWILGQIGEWQGERADINNRFIYAGCEYLGDGLLWVSLYA